uniref:Peptidase M1 leukotriene A4 hydrolase/aminopeptidase C-terminal domain-containing protein n=1 Tax=Amphiprion ocellaris TaxID=80972 RepID=A0AAQ5YQP9_AMPOC
MEPHGDLNPDTDDLPLRANTNHILVRHYVLDMTVHFDSRVISSSVVLFLEPGSGVRTKAGAGDDIGHGTGDGAGTTDAGGSQERFASGFQQVDAIEDDTKGLEKVHGVEERDKAEFQVVADTDNIQSSHLWLTTNDSDFTLVLDCCDLDVSKVEELDITSVSAMLGLQPSERSEVYSLNPQAALIQRLISMPSSQWRQKHQLFSLCSRAPGAQDGSSLHFHRDKWSLQVRKKGVTSPQDFPRAVRICYETRPTGGSVRWTKDQDNRVCVYTAGSPINNRALFPCQEPPVAMSTWQATVRAPSECVVLMSGEEQAVPTEDGDTHFFIWNYYVTMAMPASTFTLAVGHWHQVTAEIPPDAGLSVTDYSGMVDDSISCSHADYPCRFTEWSAWSQRVIPHRVFSPVCLLQKAQIGVLKLLPRCLAAAHAVLGVHPFPRLDVLIVPAGFSSLGMASPHIIFLSQSVLCAGNPGSGDKGLSLCGSRICHEIAHSWFGLVIGARDWTEEWISEGFATCLEDIIWAQAQKLSLQETTEQFDLKALLRWRRLSDELQNSREELQVLRPNMEKTGQVSNSGSSTVKHALNPEKTFMQVHYLKGYFLLRFLASQVGEQQFIDFFRLFVKKYHGQLILSQLTSDQLVMLLELLLEESELSVASLCALQRTYSLQNQDAEVRHRWCELVVKHAYAQAYGDVEHFLVHDQAMGVYLYGELMVQEDAEQQAVARRCLSLVQEEMDQSARRVVEEMVL